MAACARGARVMMTLAQRALFAADRRMVAAEAFDRSEGDGAFDAIAGGGAAREEIGRAGAGEVLVGERSSEAAGFDAVAPFALHLDHCGADIGEDGDFVSGAGEGHVGFAIVGDGVGHEYNVVAGGAMDEVDTGIGAAVYGQNIVGCAAGQRIVGGAGAERVVTLAVVEGVVAGETVGGFVG